MPASRNFLACWTVLCSLAVLLVENHGTFAAGNGPLVLWTERSHIWSKIRGIEGPPQTWLPTSNKRYVQTETEENKWRYALGYNQQSDELLWSDKNDKKIYRQPTKDAVKEKNLNNIAPVLTGTSAGINGLAVDWLAGNVYFTDGEKKTVAVAPLAASRTDLYKVLHSENVESPTGIAVDPFEGKLFWTDAESRKLETSSTDGQSREVIISSSTYVREPAGLTVDYKTRTIYFLDRSRRHIVSCNYEGENRKILHEGEDRNDLAISYFRISFWTDFLYVSTETGLQLQVFNRTSGRLLNATDLDAYIYDIIVPKEHDSPDHGCGNLNCQQICLNLGDRKGTCACAEGYYLELDGRTCSESDARFIYSIGEKIFSTKVRAEEGRPELLSAEEQLVKDKQVLVQALGFSYKGRTLFFSDTAQDVIYRGDPDGGVSSTWKELTVNTRGVEGIAVDWLSKNVYWADEMLGHIMVSHLDGRYHKILLENIGEPLGLAVDPTTGYLYWVSQETDASSPSIYRARLDGTERETFVDTDLSEPQGLVFDVRKHRLYWTDKGQRKIHYIDVTSQESKQVISRLSSRLYDVAVFRDYTTWTNGGDGLQFMLEGDDDKLDSDNLKLAAGENFDRSYDVITYGTYLQPESSGACGDGNGGCQQLCFPTPEGFACACAIGYRMKADGFSCESDSVGEEFVLYTDPYHKQIYQSSMNLETGQTHGVPVPPMHFPICADYDSGYGRLYWLDVETPAILSADMTGGDLKTVISFSGGNSQPQRLATDPTSQNLFYSTRDVIYKVNKDSGEGASFVTGIHMTTALAIDFTNGLLYWAEEGSPALIRQSPTESAAPSTVLEVEHPVSSISVIGEEDAIYYSVKEEGSIKAYNVSAQSTTVLFSDTNYDIISVSASLKYVYFTTWNEKGVYRISRADGGDFTVVDRPIFARLTDVRAYDSRMPPARIVENEEGLPIAIIAGALAVFLLLLLLLLAGLLVARRRSKAKAAAAQGAPPDVEEGVDPIYHDLGDEATEGITNPGAELTPYEEATPNGVAATNGDATANGVTSPDAIYQNTTDGVHVVPPPPPPKSGKWKFRKRSSKVPDDSENKPDKNEFELKKDNVATVIQRLTNRLRKGLSSVRFSRSEERPPLPQDQVDVTMEVNGDAQMTAIGPERGKDAPNGRKLYIPSKLHEPPRGFAPASRVVPPGITKNTLGRARGTQMATDPTHVRQKTV